MRVLIALLLTLSFSGIAKAEEKALHHCFFEHPVQPTHMATKFMTRHHVTYIVVLMWQGNEKHPSIVTAYPYKGYGQVVPFPTIYIIDRDFDGIYDEEWDDMQGNGRCDQMQRFPVMQDTDKES